MIEKRSNMAQVRMYLLRPFRIEQAGRLVHLPTRKTESLLAYLILHPSFQSRETLATLFWGNSSDASARGSLRKALNFIRKHLGREIILADREQVQLNPDFDLYCDAAEFERQASSFLSTQNPDIHEMDFELYQNELLSGFYDEWILEEREHYHQLYIKVLLRAVELFRAQSDYDTAISYARKILISDSTNEEAHQHIMFCQIALGDRNGAMQQYELCKHILQKELGVEPGNETRALYSWIVQSASDSSSLSARITNLPIPISSFVGRAHELAEIKGMLSNSRLVTLTGVGGSGKTRLAIRVATDLIGSYKHGVWWVDFSSLSNPALVPQSIARSLGVRESRRQTLTESMASFLQKKELFLVLDNCEHVVEACAQISNDLLTQCPHLKILATSREVLRINGENVFTVPTFPTPATDKISIVELLLEYESVKLFVMRARVTQSHFVFDESTALFVAQICRRLDGIPLAIELAVARLSTMSVEQIVGRLNDVFRLLIGRNRITLPRQQTLQATIDWSYDLLSKEEKILFCRLAVFVGGWSLDAAENVCVDDNPMISNVAELLTSLVEKSLIIPDTFSGQMRYNFLETIRQYSQEKFLKSKDLESVRIRHCSWVLHWAEGAELGLRGRDQIAWFRHVRAELGNIRAAVEWGLAGGQVEVSMRIMHALSVFWENSHPYHETRRWLEKGILLRENLSEISYAKTLLEAARVTQRQNELDAAYSYAEDALMIARALNDKPLLSKVLAMLILLTASTEQFAENKRYSDEAYVVCQETGDKDGLLIIVGERARLLTYRGDFSGAVELLETNLHLLGDLEDISLIAWFQFLLGGLYILQSKFDQAVVLLKKSLSIFQKIENDYFIAFTIIGFAGLANGRNDPKRAACLLGAAEIIFESIGSLLEEGSRRIHSAIVAQTKSMVDERSFSAAWADGKSLTINQVIEYALEMV